MCPLKKLCAPGHGGRGSKNNGPGVTVSSDAARAADIRAVLPSLAGGKRREEKYVDVQFVLPGVPFHAELHVYAG